ncbi:unnamed protein product [Peronospora belbahrii]|uniref:Uncharacterized protein n=1 Tax=Peronospora belbahrii TaxID=622444 RepID=A0ABN8D2W6_9STRA|nr:unnamed protein product [Peronospora belbahrii]
MLRSAIRLCLPHEVKISLAGRDPPNRSTKSIHHTSDPTIRDQPVVLTSGDPEKVSEGRTTYRCVGSCEPL